MSIKLEDYEHFLEGVDPHIHDVLEGTFHEAARVMSPSGLEEYLDGAKALTKLGRGSDLVINYLQEMPLVVKECGEDIIGDCLTAAMKLSSMTSGEVISLLFSSLPLLLWASLRVGPAMVATLVAAIGVLAAFLTYNGFGPFAGPDENVAVGLLQVFLVVIMVTGLSLAISFDQLQRSESSLRATADSLFTLRYAIDRAGDAVFLLK